MRAPRCSVQVRHVQVRQRWERLGRPHRSIHLCVSRSHRFQQELMPRAFQSVCLRSILKRLGRRSQTSSSSARAGMSPRTLSGLRTSTATLLPSSCKSLFFWKYQHISRSSASSTGDWFSVVTRDARTTSSPVEPVTSAATCPTELTLRSGSVFYV